MSELSDFSVRAAKEVGLGSGGAGVPSGDASYSLFLFSMPMQAVAGDGAVGVVSPEFITFHNGYGDELKSRLCITASLGMLAPPVPGWQQAGAVQEAVWQLKGKHIVHPDRFSHDQPLLAQWSETVDLLDATLRGRLDYPAFKSRLDRIGLPTDWRNHLINEVFRHAEAPAPLTPLSGLGAPKTAVDPLASLLDQVEVAGSAPQSSATQNSAQAFIQAVGSDTTGFVLDKETTANLLTAFQVFRKQAQNQAEKAGLDTLFGLASGLTALLKRIRGRARQIGWLVPPSARPEALAGALSEHQGSVEVLALAGFDSWDAAMTPANRFLAQRAQVILVQVDDADYGECLKAAQASAFADKTYLLLGKVRCAFGNDFCALKPAALAYVEAALASQTSPVRLVEDAVLLEDQDPCPGRSERHVAEKIWPESEWAEACRRGENRLNGKLGSASILFRPLVAVSRARPSQTSSTPPGPKASASGGGLSSNG